MGGVPKQRHTKSRRNKRRSQIFLRPPALNLCPHCQKSKPPHIVCPHCGYYNGREVVNILAKEEKKQKKKQKENKPGKA